MKTFSSMFPVPTITVYPRSLCVCGIDTKFFFHEYVLHGDIFFCWHIFLSSFFSLCVPPYAAWVCGLCIILCIVTAKLWICWPMSIHILICFQLNAALQHAHTFWFNRKAPDLYAYRFHRIVEVTPCDSMKCYPNNDVHSLSTHIVWLDENDDDDVGTSTWRDVDIWWFVITTFQSGSSWK